MGWLKRQKSVDIFTCDFVLTLHQRLFDQVWLWAGTCRTTERNIGCDPVQIRSELYKLFDDAKYWVDNKTFPPKELAARFHHRLVQIHPFPNGNGRHARIMADAILEKVMHVAPIDWSGGDDLRSVKSQRRDAYIFALRKADSGDYQPLLDFVGE